MTEISANTPRIALTGKLRSGKSSAATHLSLKHGYTILSFGDALKRMADELFNGSDVYKFEPITQDCPFSNDGKRVIGYRKPRKLYQDVGQALRELDPDVWVRQVARVLPLWENMRDVNGIVIDDLRQPNEFEWCKANGFTVIRINANEDTRLERARALGDSFDIEDLRHDTELHIDDFEADYDVWNDDVSSDELARQLDEIMEDLRK